MMPAWVPEVTPGAIGIWSLVALLVGAAIKTSPIWQLQIMQAREKLRGEERADLSDCRAEIAELRKELKKEGEDRKAGESLQTEKYHQLEMKLLGAIAAYRILDAEVQIINPDSAALVQARAVMSTAFTVSPSTDAPFPMPEDAR